MEDFQQLDVPRAKELFESEEITIIDIRDPGSYAGGHIQNSISVTDDSIDQFVKSQDKTIPLLCYCYHGISSQMTAQYFRDNGFVKVYSLAGGFEKWKNIYPDAVVVS